MACLLWAELREARFWQRVFKPLAALGFCVLAIWAGALSSFYGHLVLGALMLCALGDVALLSRGNELLFKLGMAAFALGHLVYAYAFWTLGIDPVWAMCTFAAMIVVGLLMRRYLSPHTSPDMLVTISLYMLIITAMVTTAIGTQNMMIIVPAIMFAVSDMFVARDRFVRPNPRNALVISPLYFGAQALFALSILAV